MLPEIVCHEDADVLVIIHDVMCCAFRYLLVNLPAILVICTAVTIVYVAYAIYTMSVIDNLLYDKEIEMS